ncbi:hypothetical protein EG329_004092 [Mollisiaceae sp. DMI_Dod_QoI]|nr:hypothetical protein EG329_004092 [Helotiales sp. DMI_Dod_QoI]
MVDAVALVALIISLVALFTTIGQLLQQYFATADGYRRCQHSVMGLWARKTKLRWRWGEFRFETIFVAPRILYGPLHGDVGTRAEAAGTGRCSLVQTPESLQASMTLPGWRSPEARQYYDSDQLACWVPLLSRLHEQGKDIIKHFPQKPFSFTNDTTVPSVQFVQRSWDFMPPDVVRPMASSTISDVAIMARRLGLIWKTFDPGSGAMRAEGNGHVITSTMARSLGTILQYTYTSRENAGNCYYIPVKEADKLGFGLIEFDHQLFGPNMAGDLDVGTVAGISRTLNLVISAKNHKTVDTVLKNIGKYINEGKDFIPGLNDLVPLCSAMLSVPTPVSNSLPPGAKQRWWNRIPAPNLYRKGVTACIEGRRVFQQQLQTYISSHGSTTQSEFILSSLEGLNQDYGSRWENERDWDEWTEESNIQNETKAKNHVIELHSQMTDFLRQSRVVYRDLVSEHIILATRPLNNVLEAFPADSEYGLEDFDPELVASMKTYFEQIPNLIARLVRKHPLLRDRDIVDAWLSMMFRALCWQRSHVMIEGVAPLPSEYWNSKMPVYIG